MSGESANDRDSSRLIRAWLAVEGSSRMDVNASHELPDIPPPMNRADRLKRRQMLKDKINWQQTQDAQATSTEAEDQAKLKLESGDAPKKGSKKSHDEIEVVDKEVVPIEDAVVTLPADNGESVVAPDLSLNTGEQMHDYRRVKLYGYMHQLQRIMTSVSVISQKTHFISDGEVFSAENKKLASDFVAAGKLLQSEGDKLQKIGNDFYAMCKQIEDAQEAQRQERERRAAARKSDDSTDEETLPVLQDAQPQPNCHNIEATGQYLVGKKSTKSFKHKCNVCMRTFQKAETLEGHKLIHTKDSLTCNNCKMTCTSHEYLRLHMEGHAKGGFTCEQCGAKFGVKTSYLNHAKLHLGLSYPCDKCKKSYRSKAALNVHISKEHSPNEAAEDGDGDDEAEDNDEPTMKKKKTSDEATSTPVTCGVCPKLTFKNVYSLRTHCSRWHPNKEKKKKATPESQT